MVIHLEIRGILVSGEKVVMHRIDVPHCVNRHLYNYGCSGLDLDSMGDGNVSRLLWEVGSNMKKTGGMVKPPHSSKCCLCFTDQTPDPKHTRYQAYQEITRLHRLATKYKSTIWHLCA
jgi:hypothetical protein